MQNKVRQIVDSIHGTIYISELEHQMMATPFFYRLHDVYQNSTVYMTFPSNRTKRFEHSLGTMELSGQMFFCSVANASVDDKRTLMANLKHQFDLLLKSLEDRSKLSQVKIYQSGADTLCRLIPKKRCNLTSVINMLKEDMKTSSIKDYALIKQEISFFELIDDTKGITIDEIYLYTFLYQCTLQALRIAALFHDIGHPPFSHIIENTLHKLYNNKPDPCNEDKWKKLRQCLKQFEETEGVEQLLLCTSVSNACEGKNALHEKIGLHILSDAYKTIIKKLITELGNKTNNSNRLKTLYLITVLEFTFGILLEKSDVFTSIHRIVDSSVDADRLDYIVRDSRNSGMDFGEIPYTRIINAAKFVYNNDLLKIAFSEKVCEDLDDVLVNRYKVFQRINYHHKSVKTSELLQQAVEHLATDYLQSEDGDEIMPEIENLWGSLGETFGLSEAENQISTWTDSWLISILNNALITLSDSQDNADTDINKLNTMLNEVLLSKKRYFPLLKRQRDALLLKDAIIAEAGLTDEALDKLSTHEYNKLITETGVKADSAREALYRIEILRNEVLNIADFGLLDRFLPGNVPYAELIEEILTQELKSNKISDYFIWPNAGLWKFGVSDKDITLYRRNSEVYSYDISTSLMKKLHAQRSGCLWMFIYVCLNETSQEKNDETIKCLLEKIAKAIGKSIKEQMNDLFDFDNVING